MIKINDYAEKNHLNEWEIKDLPESEVYRLDLVDGNLTLLLYFLSDESFEKKLFIPWLPRNNQTISFIHSLEKYNISTLDYPNYWKGKIIDITANWSKYIPKDHGVLFLNPEDKDRYIENFMYHPNLVEDWFMLKIALDIKNIDIDHIKKCSIIIPSIHSKNIQELNNIVKELKEKYGVEWVEVIATHCFIEFYGAANRLLKYERDSGGGSHADEYIDKIITTDSTGILEIQNNERFEVVDCEEFFNN